MYGRCAAGVLTCHRYVGHSHLLAVRAGCQAIQRICGQRYNLPTLELCRSCWHMGCICRQHHAMRCYTAVFTCCNAVFSCCLLLRSAVYSCVYLGLLLDL